MTNNNFIQDKMKECGHHIIGRGMIEHSGISHPGGEQKCLDCFKTLESILKDSYTRGVEDALVAVKSAKVGILGTPSSTDTQTIINIVVDTVARSKNIKI